MKILIDNGHGITTPGKCSPDGQFREYEYARRVARETVSRLKAAGYDADLLVPEDADIALPQRAARANAQCDIYGKTNVLLISIHTDAAPGPGWQSARGLSVRVSPSASDRSRQLATLLYDTAARYGKAVTGNRATPKTKYWQQSLYILNATRCPAILTENLFHTNRQDVAWLLSPEGLNTVVSYHVDAIKAYIARYGKK